MMHEEVGPRHSSNEADQRNGEEAHCGGVCGGERSGVDEARRGRGQGEVRPSTTRTGPQSQARVTETRWSVYGHFCRHTPEVGAVCGKAARTVLCGGRA